MRFSHRRLMLAAGFAVLPSTLLAKPETATAPARAAAPVSTLSALGVTGCPGGLTPGSSASPAGGRSFVVCTGRVRSFDGTPLDTDVTIPTAPTSRPRPLFIFLHGWGQDKATWGSTTLAGNNTDSYHWNNAWFAAQGYVVLNYTARGFHTSCAKGSSYGVNATTVVHRDSAAAQATASSNAPTVEGTNADPILNSGCRSMASQSDPNQAIHSSPVPTGTLAGAPIVNVDVAVNGLSAEVAARLWEVTPGGTQTLITRSVYRVDDAAPTGSDHLAFELWPQAWQFQRGDQLKPELTQDDQPV